MDYTEPHILPDTVTPGAAVLLNGRAKPVCLVLGQVSQEAKPR
jgi:hypothetical protein